MDPVQQKKELIDEFCELNAKWQSLQHQQQQVAEEVIAFLRKSMRQIREMSEAE